MIFIPCTSLHRCSLPGGNLQSYLTDHMILSEQEASRLLRKVVEGLQYLHEARIIHCNLTVSPVSPFARGWMQAAKLLVSL